MGVKWHTRPWRTKKRKMARTTRPTQIRIFIWNKRNWDGKDFHQPFSLVSALSSLLPRSIWLDPHTPPHFEHSSLCYQSFLPKLDVEAFEVHPLGFERADKDRGRARATPAYFSPGWGFRRVGIVLLGREPFCRQQRASTEKNWLF